jgi:hypothetical protein
VVSFTPLLLLFTGEEHPICIRKEVGWAPEPVWTQYRKEKSLLLPGIEPKFLCRPTDSAMLRMYVFMENDALH